MPPETSVRSALIRRLSSLSSGATAAPMWLGMGVDRSSDCCLFASPFRACLQCINSRLDSGLGTAVDTVTIVSYDRE